MDQDSDSNSSKKVSLTHEELRALRRAQAAQASSKGEAPKLKGNLRGLGPALQAVPKPPTAFSPLSVPLNITPPSIPTPPADPKDPTRTFSSRKFSSQTDERRGGEGSSGSTTRRIEAERKRRSYESQDLEDLLRTEGVDYSTGAEISYLPLEAFDNTEFETKSALEWLGVSADGSGDKQAAQGKALRLSEDGRGRWLDCAVLDQDSKDNKLVVQYEDGSQVKLSRVHVMFKGEDPSMFAHRVGTAHKARRQAESLLRYNLYVDSMPTDEIPPLGEMTVDNIRYLSLSTRRLRDNERILDIHTLLSEVQVDYARTMNKIIFDTTLKSDPSQAEMLASLQLPQDSGAQSAPEYGLVDIPVHDFIGDAKAFNFHTYMNQPQVIEALGKVREECNKVLKLRVFNTSVTRVMRLEEYDQMQTMAIGHITAFLKENWLQNLRVSIKTSLAGVGKGWLNIDEKNKEIYEISKLKRLMTTVRFMMEDTLRMLVDQSCADYARFIEDYCKFIVSMSDDGSIVNVQPGDPEDPRPSLFFVDLIEREGVLRFSTPIEKFAEIPYALFDKALIALQDIPQLEPLVMDQFFWSQIPMLHSVGLDEPHINSMRDRIKNAMSRALEPLSKYLGTYSHYQSLSEISVPQYIKTYEEAKHTVDEMKQEIARHLTRKQEIMNSIPMGGVNLGTFIVDCNMIRNQLSKKTQDLAKQVMDLMARLAREKSTSIREQFHEITAKVTKPPKDIERLVEVKDYMKSVPEAVATIEKTVDEMRVYYDVLESFQYQLGDDDFKQKWTSIGASRKLDEQLATVDDMLNKKKDAMYEGMVAEQEAFAKDLEKMARTIASFSKHSDMNKVAEIAAEVKQHLKVLKEYDERSRMFNSRENLFGAKPREYTNLQNMIKDFDPYAQLWTTANDWLNWYASWMNDPFQSLDPEQMEKDFGNSWRVMYKAVKTFKDMPAILKIADDIKRQIDDFKPIMPLVTALRNPGMRDRHWEALSALLGFELRPGDTLNSLKDIYSLGLLDRSDEITKVCDTAAKEYGIERALDKMVKEWEDITFDLHAYKETGTCVLKGFDEIGQLLDDHIVMTQSMGFSPFKKYFEERISTWESKLALTSEIMDEWLACQKSWLYLEPIFSSEDIMKQLPQEGKRFTSVDRTYKKIIAQAKAAPSVLPFCSTTPKLVENFQECNKLLDLVQKGLNDYLETKRQAFARFYFLDNEGLLQILSQTKDPRAVQPHLRKCFEAINKLEFQSDSRMTAMISGEGEQVAFDSGILPKGNVENWLGEVETMMKKSINSQCRQSVSDYTKTPRKEWVLRWPGQVVLVGSQIFWTKEVTEALIANGTEGLKEYHKKLQDQLLDLTEVVRANISKLNRITLGALITIDVHARDVVQSMIEEGTNSVNDFEWISQMRYYWEEDHVIVRQVEAAFDYGCEYLGNSSRLVITPLTDRIYLTLTGALDLHLGGAPAGPAGTGKTETVKDLAKALAKQCVVFNCQEGLDYQAMGKFFRGLAMSGAWACFDEFNRIDVEVLSVVAQQISTMTTAIIQGQKRFMFEGTEISLDPTCAVFITMNPGYAGRTELPDNLKALFRPVACMVPDYALIGEIRMVSFGFRNAKALARKMVATFRLSSEQLSSQDHYDFGMRAVNTVISAAGLLKREDPDMDEGLLLLRALRDSNLPKFLSDDIILFNGIISDLFPDVEPPVVDYGNLMSSLLSTCTEMGLQQVELFIKKCIQLYETTVLRHGLMLVGPTGAGKTTASRVLAKAMTSLKQSGDQKYERVKTFICNPKSITMGQLYGQFDEATHEWTDGILAKLFRDAVDDTTTARKWVMFDGPVDALWIESMNTVLDENKKLCLVSGEIITMTPHMNIMFEVEDLAVASPATVSRCGMIYMEPSTCVGTAALVTSWLQALPDVVRTHEDQLQSLFDKMMQPCLDYVRRNLKEYVGTVDNNLTRSCFNILDSFYVKFVPVEGIDMDPERAAALAPGIESMFLFAVIWGVGGSCDLESRKKFDQFFRKAMASSEIGAGFPEKGLVYDYCYDIDKKQWIHWTSTVPEYKLDPRSKFSDIIVPTTDSIRYTWLVEHLCSHRHHVLCVGPTGTGKTLNVMDKLMRGMPEQYIPIFVAFSAQTSANMTQDILDAKFDKRRKGVFGPPAGKVNVIFVDDLNMPAREKYGAQPPIELLRQWMDHKGWYDRKALQFREIIDICFVGAMGPPGGGRNVVTNRFLRHFNFVAFPEMEDDSMRRIFGTILNTFLGAYFPDPIKEIGNTIVSSSIEVYNTICKELLPTPSKSHYTFNLRDLAKIFQGLLSAEPKRMSAPQDLLRLWTHELSRVFRDRLINQEDRTWLDTLIKQQLRTNFNMDWKSIVTSERLIYGDFMIPGAEPKIYDEIPDLKKMTKVIEEYLEDYNAQTNKKMKLVLFLDAIEHVSRIARIIRQPGGNALLLGIGGSGRQSLTRLATSMAEYKIFQIEIAKGYGMVEWRNDLKKVLLTSGMEGNPIVFLFSDTQIVKEAFLEDINNILNSGEVPNLWDLSDVDNILNAMRPICQAENLPVSKISLYARFIKRVKENIHIVLCMSPIGEAFRNRLRMFPSLVNCCTIDWFSEWPEEALRSVATDSFDTVPLGDKQTGQGVIDMCVFIHQSVERISKRYLAELRRHNYVTPTSYLELLTTFKKLLTEKRAELATARRRLEVGLDKLVSTEGQVKKLKVELTEMQPVLIETSKKVESMMINIQEEKVGAEETRVVVVKDEAEASKKAAECKKIADEAQQQLDEALPALDAALKVLGSLKQSEVSEVGKYAAPPGGVKLCLEAVCVMLGEKPVKVGEAGKKVDDYWPTSQGLLKDPKGFLESLYSFNRDNIPEVRIQKIQKYIDDPNFDPKKIESVSSACTAMCQWVRAMHKYHFIAKAVAPLRENLKVAEEELEVVTSNLNETKRKLKEVEDKIADLESKFSESVAKKEELAKKVEECSLKLDRAERLIGGLGGEKIRWTETVEQLKEREVNIIGDIIISAGSVAYLGPFTAVYRNDLVKEWAARLHDLGLPNSKSANIRSTLADPVAVRHWTICGLPSDAVSVENAIILSKARRWPLLIDPQGQGNKWIKNMEKENLEVVKPTDNILRSLENALSLGRPVLLENVGEELDPALEPILLKQTFKESGTEMIKLGDKNVPYSSDFRFYMTTKLRNPHYSPETSVKVTLLNFFITPDGLEDQLLGIVVAKERPDLEEMKNQLVVSNAKMKKELKEIEDTILRMLSESTGDILDDESLISTLGKSKKTSEEIKLKVEEAEKTEVEIDTTRNKYRPVAFRGSLLFFCVADLALVDPMYQYSLQWFINLFVQACDNSEKSDVFETRLLNLNDYFTFSLYRNVCRSLFEKHKLLFSFTLCIKILQGDNLIDPTEWRFLITGGLSTEAPIPNPAPDWLVDKTWAEIVDLSKLPNFQGFEQDVVKNVEIYKRYFESSQSHREPLSPEWDAKLGGFQKMLVLRCLRPDKVIEAIQDFCSEKVGSKYIEPPTFDLPGSYKDSTPTTPLVFVLSPGADPRAELDKFADEMRFSKKLQSISLGQGQGPHAEKMIMEAVERGTWVLLQNCHLAVSWMPSLERIVENLSPEKTHRDFRLWLTSMPSPKFPVSVLQNSVKITNEPPKGLRMNLLQSYMRFDDKYLETSKKPNEFKKLLFGLCFFHAVIQERRKFGPLGWNIRYEYTTGDLNVCIRQLQLFLDRYDEVPYKVLKFLTGQINYGGRVTDDWDRRTLMTLLGGFISPDVLGDGYQFSPSGTYFSPASGEHSTYLDYIRALPINPAPEVFGLHENADISCARAETFEIMETLLSLQPRVSSGGGKSREQVIGDVSADILKRVPDPFDMYAVTQKYPTTYSESMNTVLVQECIRYNRLLVVIKRSLRDILNALKGLVVMSEQLEKMGSSLYDNQVPEMWNDAPAYPSLKPLSAWIVDLLARVEFINNWVKNGPPPVFWISGFFFPQAFLTGTLQNFARKLTISIDTVSFEFIVMNETESQIKEKPSDGCYIRGLILEGARWDATQHSLADSRPKELYTDMPIIWLKPIENRQPPKEGVYNCPVYKTLTRAGTLSTTGHSTNYVLTIDVPSNQPQQHWVKRGVALLCALNY